jgi:soluble cytochrome b562
MRAIACACLLVAAPLAHAGEIRTLMRDMNQAMKGAMASTTMPQLSSYVSRLERDARQASRQRYSDDQATYDEGMKALGQELAEVDRAIKADDMAAAKRGLHRIISTRNHYHNLLS